MSSNPSTTSSCLSKRGVLFGVLALSGFVLCLTLSGSSSHHHRHESFPSSSLSSSFRVSNDVGLADHDVSDHSEAAPAMKMRRKAARSRGHFQAEQSQRQQEDAEQQQQQPQEPQTAQKAAAKKRKALVKSDATVNSAVDSAYYYRAIDEVRALIAETDSQVVGESLFQTADDLANARMNEPKLGAVRTLQGELPSAASSSTVVAEYQQQFKFLSLDPIQNRRDELEAYKKFISEERNRAYLQANGYNQLIGTTSDGENYIFLDNRQPEQEQKVDHIHVLRHHQNGTTTTTDSGIITKLFPPATPGSSWSVTIAVAAQNFQRVLDHLRTRLLRDVVLRDSEGNPVTLIAVRNFRLNRVKLESAASSNQREVNIQVADSQIRRFNDLLAQATALNYTLEQRLMLLQKIFDLEKYRGEQNLQVHELDELVELPTITFTLTPVFRKTVRFVRKYHAGWWESLSLKQKLYIIWSVVLAVSVLLIAVVFGRRILAMIERCYNSISTRVAVVLQSGTQQQQLQLQQQQHKRSRSAQDSNHHLHHTHEEEEQEELLGSANNNKNAATSAVSQQQEWVEIVVGDEAKKNKTDQNSV